MRQFKGGHNKPMEETIARLNGASGGVPGPTGPTGSTGPDRARIATLVSR